LEPGTISVEDTDEVGVYAVVAVVCGDGSLREALGFIVDGARADGIDAAPIGFDLGVDLGVAVALGGGRVEEASVVFAGEVQGVDGACRTDEESFGAEASVVGGAGGRGEVEDIIDLARIKWLRDVVFEKAEAALVFEVAEIGEVPGAEVIDTDNCVSCSE
jgi:hypothetical protein